MSDANECTYKSESKGDYKNGQWKIFNFNNNFVKVLKKKQKPCTKPAPGRNWTE